MSIVAIDLNEVVEQVLTVGPTRVVTSARDDCVEYAEPTVSAACKGVYPDVVYIRDDGWSLGAEDSDEAAAERLYRGDWIARLCLRSGRLTVL